MKKFFVLQLVLMLATRALAGPTFTTKEVPVNRGGEEDGTVTLLFYDDMPTVPYIDVSDFQKLMLPGTSIEVTKTGEGEYLLKGPYAEATVNTTTEVFTSDDYMGFTNLMGLLQEGMDNVYYDGAPFVRYNRQELTPASATVTFEFQKYGIDLRSDDNTVYFPLATLSDIYSDLYYHVAGYNGENVDVITDNSNANIAKFDPEGVKRVLAAESRSADMAAFSYGELCFVVDHFYGMPGRSPLEEAIRNDGLDAALDKAEHGAQIKALLKSTDMKEYIFGMDCLQLLLDDGGHTMTLVDIMAAEYFEETEEENLDDNDDLDNLDDNDNDNDDFDDFDDDDSDDNDDNDDEETIIDLMMDKYPELAYALYEYYESHMTMSSPKATKIQDIKSARPTEGTYYKKGDTAYLLLDTFGETNFDAWEDYYEGGCKGDLPAIDKEYLGDLSVVLDALKRADEDPEVKNFVVDLSTNLGGSLDVVLAMTALMGGQTHFYSENVLTGQRQIISYDVDTNFDGVFDDNDKVVRHNLNIGVLTTDIAFSCGNLFPSLMKDMGFPIIGEKSGGGACAIQQFITPEGLQYQLSSARARLTNNRWENIDGGIEPDFVIDLSDNDGMQDYSALYDFATIGGYISSATQSGISELPAAPAAADGQWHTLDGRRLQGQPAVKGVYIYQGKKFIIN